MLGFKRRQKSRSIFKGWIGGQKQHPPPILALKAKRGVILGNL